MRRAFPTDHRLFAEVIGEYASQTHGDDLTHSLRSCMPIAFRRSDERVDGEPFKRCCLSFDSAQPQVDQHGNLRVIGRRARRLWPRWRCQQPLRVSLQQHPAHQQCANCSRQPRSTLRNDRRQVVVEIVRLAELASREQPRTPREMKRKDPYRGVVLAADYLSCGVGGQARRYETLSKLTGREDLAACNVIRKSHFPSVTLHIV